MPARKRKPTAKKSSRARASWKGNLTFGLVTFPCEAFNAIDREQSDIHFNQLHEKCHRRIRYQKVCPVHGEVSNDEIVSGYEYEKGSYVEIDADELDALRSESRKALKIDTFVPPDAIDPIYFDGRMYYLIPSDESAEEAFAVFVEAMESEGCYGVGQVVFSGKEQIVLLRPYRGVLHMAMLNYEQEIRPPEKLADTLPKPRGIAKQVKLAKTLISQWTEDRFDFSSYEDDYREQLQRIIKAKVSGKEIVTPQEPEERPDVLSLMDALKKSLAKSKSATSRSSAKPRRRKKTA